MFSKLGQLVVAHPWRVIGIWLVALLLVVLFAPRLSEVTNTDQTSFLPDSYESVKAQKLAERFFPNGGGTSALFVVQRRDDGRLSSSDRRTVASFARLLAGGGIGRVTAVTASPREFAPNGKLQLVRVSLQGTSEDEPVKAAVRELRERAGRLLAGTGLSAGLTGDAAIQFDTEESFATAERVVGAASAVLILLLLSLVFRSGIATVVPLASIALVFLLSTGLLALTAKTFDFDVGPELQTMLIVVLFGIGTDYILFLLFRYRERLRAGEEPKRAIAFAVARVGEAIASSGAVVIAAFLALAFSEFGSSRSMAPGFVIAILVMLLAALTLVPALLALAGPGVFWPSRHWREAPRQRIFPRLGRKVARRPARTALAAAALLLALGVGAFFYRADYDPVGQLPGGTEAGQAFDVLKTAFPVGALNPTEIYVAGEKQLDEKRLRMLQARLVQIDGVADVALPVLGKQGQAARIVLQLEERPYSEAALDLVAGPIRAAAHAWARPGETALVGGQTSAFADIRAATSRDFGVVFPVAALAIALILGLVLRSLVGTAYLLAAAAVGFAATLGATVALFQGLAGEAGLTFNLPMLVYLFVVAVGTDYNILVTSRLREEIREGNAPRPAAALAVEHAGPTVAAAGVILAGTFASLTLTGVGLLAQIGFAIAIGIVLVAFVMATVLTPSVAALLGRKIWWPGHQDRPERAGPRDRKPAAVPGEVPPEARPK